MTSNPNHSQWTATNAMEALNLIDAARQLIEAHLTALYPAQPIVRTEQKKNIALSLAIDLDLTGLHQIVSETRSLQTAYDSDDYTG